MTVPSGFSAACSAPPQQGLLIIPVLRCPEKGFSLVRNPGYARGKSRLINAALLWSEVVQEDELKNQVIARELLGQGGKWN